MVRTVQSWGKAILFGFLVWLVPFVISFLVYTFHDSNRPLFESIMAVAVVTAVIIFVGLYFKNTKGASAQEGLIIGMIWFSISIAIDLLMFMWGPMKMTFVDYLADIGATYLIIPIITTGAGYLRSKK